MDEIDRYMKNLKIQKSTLANGQVEIKADDVIVWFNSGKSKRTYVEEFIEEIKELNMWEDWKREYDHYRVLGYPIVTNCPQRIKLFILSKNCKVISRRKL